MIEISHLWAMLIGEALLILLAITSSLVLSGSIRRRRERDAARALIAKVGEDEVARRRLTREWLGTRYQYSGEGLLQA